MKQKNMEDGYSISENSYWFWWDKYIQLKFELEIEIKGLKYQINMFDKYLDYLGETQTKLIESLRSDNKNEQLSDYLDDYEFEQFAIKLSLRSFMLESSCLIIYSYIERNLLKICKMLESEFKLEKICKEQKQNIIKEYWNFLKKTVSLDLDDVEKYYTRISTQTKIRNSIAHHNNELKKDIPNAPGLKKNKKQFEIINKSYPLYLIEATDKMFSGILKSIAIKKRDS